jgi:ABC-type transport system involved in multi-copper enzyme maturation permease subunit
MKRIFVLAHTVWLEMLRRKDFYVMLILLGAMVFVLMSVDVFGLGGTDRYVLDVGLLLTWLFSCILAVNFTARQLPREEERRTVYPLLAKPVSRLEVLLGKWLGAWLAAGMATLVFYVVIAGLLVLRGGDVQELPMLQAWGLHLVALGVLAAFALACSTRMSHEAASTVSFVFLAGAVLILPRVPELLLHEQGWKATALLVMYYLFPHFELYDMRTRVVHGWGAMPWGPFLAVVLYGAVFMALFILLAWLGYRQKRFRRGSML